MTPLVLDVETTTIEKGNPYVKNNKLCYVGLYDGEITDIFKAPMFNIGLQERQIIGFNLKFDLTWLRRSNVDYSTCSVWDCQLAHFILTGQTQSYPSLNSVAEYYGLGSKLDVVATEYWDKGIDTPDIPQAILEEYLTQDLMLTWQVYQKQIEHFKEHPQLFKLFQLQCEDLLVLLEMEWNGLLLDEQGCQTQAVECYQQLESIDSQLKQYTNDVPINFNSGDHLSCLLYGGTIKHETTVFAGTFKTGPRAGQPKPKKVVYEFKLPQLVKPLKGSELQKEGYYSTDEDTLKSLKGNKAAKKLIELLLERAKVEKLVSTYYVGWQKHVADLDGLVHGQFNQCVARTGRLSSSKPNQQNIDKTFKKMMISRYN